MEKSKDARVMSIPELECFVCPWPRTALVGPDSSVAEITQEVGLYNYCGLFWS